MAKKIFEAKNDFLAAKDYLKQAAENHSKGGELCGT
jgi:hypothetical protein